MVDGELVVGGTLAVETRMGNPELLVHNPLLYTPLPDVGDMVFGYVVVEDPVDMIGMTVPVVGVVPVVVVDDTVVVVVKAANTDCTLYFLPPLYYYPDMNACGIF